MSRKGLFWRPPIGGRWIWRMSNIGESFSRIHNISVLERNYLGFSKRSRKGGKFTTNRSDFTRFKHLPTFSAPYIKVSRKTQHCAPIASAEIWLKNRLIHSLDTRNLRSCRKGDYPPGVCSHHRLQPTSIFRSFWSASTASPCVKHSPKELHHSVPELIAALVCTNSQTWFKNQRN